VRGIGDILDSFSVLPVLRGRIGGEDRGGSFKVVSGEYLCRRESDWTSQMSRQNSYRSGIGDIQDSLGSGTFRILFRLSLFCDLFAK
jgi:hypothetical protein